MNLAAKNEQRNLPPGWALTHLAEVCKLNPSRPSAMKIRAESPVTFVPMASVDEESGTISRPLTRPFVEVQKGYTYFAEGDVLFAKITPCMQNGKHAVARNLLGGFGFGTTEFHVIRPLAAVISEWIYFTIRQPRILEAATALLTGAVGQQRVPESYLAELEIPLPPLEEQKRIVAILNERIAAVAQARAATEAQLEAARAFPAAYLHASFSDSESRRWPTKELGEVLKLRKDIVHPRDSPKGPAPFVGLEHIASVTGKRLGCLDLEMAELTGRKPKFFKGDIVYGYLRPYLNKVWVAEFDGLCSVDQYVFCVDSAKANTDFVAWYMRSPLYLKKAPVNRSPGQLPRIRTEEVLNTKILLPSLDEQDRVVSQITEQLSRAEKSSGALKDQLGAITQLPAAILRQAFIGEL